MIHHAAFRKVLGHYPTGVCVITSADVDRRPIGMAVGSFTSVSLDPPLVAFLPDRRSSTWQGIQKAGRFCVNVLSARQEDLSRRFASPSADKFEGLEYRRSELGLPILEGVVAWIDCTIHSVHDAGDHFIAIGQVAALEAGNPIPPLVFHKGGYSQLSRLAAAA